MTALVKTESLAHCHLGCVLVFVWTLLGLAASPASAAPTLEPATFRPYIDRFNSEDHESYQQTFPNARSWDFLQDNIPLFECPDKDLELTYYFRWWTFRKHLKQTPEGWVITEFLPAVPWAGKSNTISCAAPHHLQEARWLKNREFAADYLNFWFTADAPIRRYSFWVADSAWAWAEVTGDFEPVKRLLPNLVTNYEAWERERFDPQVGLFWQLADSDGMEGPIGGHGYRPTINAYMYGDALAIARISDLCGRADWAADYRKKAADLKRLVQHRLWNPDQEFFEVHEAIGSMGLLGWRINRDIQSTKRATPSASVRADTKALASLNSGSEPARSWDGSAPQLRFPGRMGTKEWVQYDFPEALTISNLQVYLLGGHLMDLPQSFRVFSRKNGQWQSLEKVKGRIDQKNRWNELTFDALKADGLRLEFSLKGFDRTALGLRNVRELLGFVPWCFNLPDSQYSIAWRQLNDPQGFAAPWGLTTAEQRHPEFQIRYDGHHCLWNGPVWPFATTQTLVALANLLNNYQQDVVGKRAYFDALITYARSHRMILPDGKIIPWIDEDQHPYTGEWVARSILARNPKAIPDRGKDYNHSGFCDLVISGLVGLRPQAGQEIVLNPLLPENTWNYFCLDRVPYHGHTLTILYDKSGKQYKRGVGLRVFEGDRLIAASPTLARLEGRLNP